MKNFYVGIGFLFSASVAQLAAFDSASFSPHVDFPAGSGQVGLAFGDLDGDGKPDAVAANYSSGSISVYRNSGTGGVVNASSFAARINFAVGGTPVMVRIGDVDGDGKPDVVVVNQASSTVSVLRNVSTPGALTAASFRPAYHFSTTDDPRGMCLADLDGDGKLDLAVVCDASQTISVFRNTSTVGTITNSTFAPRVDIAQGRAPNVVAADVDGDGKLDLITGLDPDLIAVYRNLSTAGNLTTNSFAPRVNFTAGGVGPVVAVGDIDGDGKTDLLSANQLGDNLSVLRNTSVSGSINSNSFAARVDFATGSYPYDAWATDLDGDGKADITVSDAGSGTVSVFRNVSIAGVFTSASLAARVNYLTGHGPRLLALADLDGDGRTDIGTANLGQSSFSVLRQTAGTTNPPPIHHFDLSRDFSAVSNPSGVWTYGWKASAGGAFGPLIQTAAATADNNVPVHAWVLANHGQPAVYANDSASTAVGAVGQFVMPPGTIWVHPGLNGRPENFGTVRFIAPSNANYRVETSVNSIYSGYLSRDNEFRVAVNGVEVFGQFLPALTGTGWSNVLVLNAGETVDFLVGRGADGNEYGSALKLAAFVSATTSPGLIVTNRPPQPPTDQGNFNLARDFSAISNPAGAWRYGWKNSLAGSFTTDPFNFSATSDNGVSVAGWAANHTIGLPAHYCNTTTTTAIIGSGQGVLPPGTFWMHPGANGQPENFGAVRFTAPSNSNYHVETRADSLYTGYLSGDTDYHVVVNGVEVFGQSLAATQGTGWTNIVALNAGDTIDLALGRGADGNSYGAGLRIAALVTPTTNGAVIITNEPPVIPPVVVHGNFDAGRDFLASVNPSGAWSYGWKGNLDASFTLHPIHFGASSDNGVAVSGWAANSAIGLPALYCNTSANTAIIGGGQGILPPGTMWFHPGANGQPENFGALRFTAPSNANYRLVTVVNSLYTGSYSGDTDFHVVVNGLEIFGQGLPAAAGTSFSNVVALAAGDTVDFALGRGADGNGYGAGLKISALLTPTTDAPAVITNPPPTAPVIVSQPPLTLSANVGGTVALHVTASGSPVLSYQWLFNGAAISGATDVSLLLSNVQPEQAGNYRVIVSNPVGSVTNAGTSLSVNAAVGGTVNFANQSSNRVYEVGGSSLVPAGGSLVVGLFHNTNGGGFAQVGGTTPFIFPGRFLGGYRYLPGTVPGQSVELQVRVWDTAFGTTYDDAAAGRRGVSPAFNVTLAGGVTPPNYLHSMPEFALTLPGLNAAQVKSVASLPLALRYLTRTGEGWAFMVTGASGATYAIETSPDLVQWKTAAYVVAGEAGTAEFLHRDLAGTKCFYRAKLVSP